MEDTDNFADENNLFVKEKKKKQKKDEKKEEMEVKASTDSVNEYEIHGDSVSSISE